MELIPQLRQAWRYLTMHVAALAVVFGALPPDQQAQLLELLHVPEHRVPLVLGLLFAAARVVRQPSIDQAAQGPKP